MSPLSAAQIRPTSSGVTPADSRRWNRLVTGSDVPRTSRPGVKLTYDDFVHFPDDGKRHELIDGEHYVTPSPNRGTNRSSST